MLFIVVVFFTDPINHTRNILEMLTNIYIRLTLG